MDRRKLLGIVLVALLAAMAGCSGEGSISMDPVENDSLAEQASHEISVIDPGQDRSLVREAIENGSTTGVGSDPPVSGEFPLRYDGAFYNLSYAEVGTQPGHVGGIRIDYNATSVDGEVVEYESLPAIDRTTLNGLLTLPEFPDSRLEPGYDFGIELRYTESDAEASVLVADQEYDAVRYEGETYPIEVEAESGAVNTYRYESTVVAETASEYATALREEYEFELAELSDAERDVLENALNDTNYIEDSDNNGFDSLVDRFRAQRPVVDDGSSGSYVVRYDGQHYWVEVYFGSYLDDEDVSS
jgi:hypothetical protein